jgi:predicted lipid-binding transport protein (Tim44 family)
MSPASPPLAYSPAGAAPHSVAAATSGAGAGASRWPADFNAEEFLRHARPNFVKLQDAHDRRDIAAIRDFLTPELARDIEADMRAAGNAPQKTDVVTLNAEVLDVASEDGLYVVSVRFSGLIRETPGTEPQPFNEIWHIEKPVSGRSGWQVAGIQQA